MREINARISLILVSICFATFSEARPIIQTSVNPERSRNGEAVLFKIQLQNKTRDYVKPPRMPVLSDWDVISVSENAFPTTRIIGGQITYLFRAEYTYVLKPLRKGLLKIPPLSIQVGNIEYKSEEMKVQVDSLPGSALRRPPLHSAPPNPFSNDDEDRRGMISYPEGQDIFLKAEASKTNVYQGEMILLSYVLYQKNIPLTNPEIAKFPDFKGVLKEELLVPKVFTRTPTNVGGQTFFKSELLRYAVFPLNTGITKIEPMIFKGYLPTTGMDDVIDSLLMGQPPPSISANPIPLTKSSETLTINAKPLPPAPAGAAFTGGIGHFSLSVTGPSSSVQVDQPFSVNLTIGGRGNFKTIEESPLTLSSNLEQTQVRNSYQFKEDGSGTKTFEYLIVPRAPGNAKIEAVRFTYFDPERGQYQELVSDPIELKVEGSASSAPSKSVSAPTPVPLNFIPPQLKGGTFTKIDEIQGLAFFARKEFWILQIILYLAAGLLFLWRKRVERRNALYKNSPYKKTADLILSKKQWKSRELSILIDQYIRQRLASEISSPQLHGEASRDEFSDYFRSKLHVEKYRQIDELRKFWNELDLLRFSGSQQAGENEVNPKEWLSKAEALVTSLFRQGVAS